LTASGAVFPCSGFTPGHIVLMTSGRHPTSTLHSWRCAQWLTHCSGSQPLRLAWLP
jgi:hypothetical protein